MRLHPNVELPPEPWAPLTADEIAAVRAERRALAAPPIDALDAAVATRDDELAGVPVRWFEPDGLDPASVVVWAHGGGWVYGGPVESDARCRRLARLAGMRVVAVDYRLAPEHPWPAGSDDVDAVVAALQAAGPDAVDGAPPLVVLAGDSAGGWLVLAAARRARDADRAVAGQALVYPVVDRGALAGRDPDEGSDAMLTVGQMEWFWDLWQGAAPLAALDADTGWPERLAGLPPTLVVLAEHDILREEGQALADALQDADVHVVASTTLGHAHGFMGTPALRPAATHVIDQVAAWARDVVAADVAPLAGGPDVSTPDAGTSSTDGAGPTADDAVSFAPIAPRRTVTTTRFGRDFVDHYGWMRDAEDPATLAWLQANNDHTEARLAHLADLRATIVAEIKGRTVETDTSAGVIDDGWVYSSRTVEGHDYAIHVRRPASGGRHDDVAPTDPASPPSDEQVLLDGNVEAAGGDYFGLGGLSVSPDHRLLAWLGDRTGRELYDLHVRDLDTGQDTVVATGATYGLAWSADSTRLYWVLPDDTQRPHKVLRHAVGGRGGADHDVEVFHEADQQFWLSLGSHRSDDLVEIAVGSATTTEVWLLDMHDPQARPWVVAPRRSGIEYEVEHDPARARLLVVTNDAAPDFRIEARALDGLSGLADVPATSVREHEQGVRIDGVDAFDDALLVTERTNARVQVRVLDPRAGDADRGVIEWPEEVATATVSDNPDVATEWYRFSYTSQTTPPLEVELRLDPAEPGGSDRVPIKQLEVPGYDADGYRSWRDWATAPDGTRVPVSLVARRDLGDGPHPLLLYGYGSYEISLDPAFSKFRVSLLDRGVVVATAHVRGGGEMGRQWYLDGKFEAKPTTFSDFIAVADHLVAQGLTAHERMVLQGGSAGGLLMGAVVNARPDLAAGVVAQVPFVDVLSTMSDPTLPLTVNEYEEWGNPLEERWFDVIAAYSPYDNVPLADFPAMLVTGGLNDPRVGYWEPAKWVARLRDRSTGERPIMLRTELGAGHAGPSGRYGAWEQRAFELAFVAEILGVAESSLAAPGT